MRGGPPELVAEILARARKNAGVTEVPTRAADTGVGNITDSSSDNRPARADATPEGSAPPPSAPSPPEEAGHAPGPEKAGPPPQPAAGDPPSPAAARTAPEPKHQAHLCGSCSASILWAMVLEEDRKTVKTKPRRCNLEPAKPQMMPVDYAPSTDPKARVVCLARGRSIVAYVLKKDEVPAPGVRLRIAHHLTCKHAAQWKAAARERKLR